MDYVLIKDFVKSGEIEIKTGPFGTQLKASEYTETGTPVLNVRNLGFGDIRKEKIECVGPETIERLSIHLLHEGDIVFGRKGAVERFAYISSNEHGWMQGSDCIRIRINTEKINSRYLSYFFLTKAHQAYMMSACSHGTTMASLNQGILEQITFPVCDRQTQDKIAYILQALDDKIALNTRINENIEQQMEAIYTDWFINYAKNGGTCPTSWERKNIYSIASIIYGAPFSSKLFNTDGEGLPIIRIRDLKEQAFVTYTTEIHPKGYLIQPGDIIVGMDGEFRPYIWGNTEAWLNQRVCIFDNKRPKGKAFVLLSIKPLLKHIEQTQVGTTVIHIGKKDFDKFEIILPDPDTLDKFDELTAPMILQIVNNRLESRRLERIRDTLLPKLMSGELDVSNIEL